MMDMLRKRRDDEEGFTLIELMVVVLIIAILLAIAIPTFLGARERANDRAAQSSLRNALTAAKTIFTDEQDYTQASATNLVAVEPSLTYVTADSTDFREVSIDPSAADTWAAAALSASGACFYIRDVAANPGGTTYGEDSSGAACAGTDATAGATESDF